MQIDEALDLCSVAVDVILRSGCRPAFPLREKVIDASAVVCSRRHDGVSGEGIYDVCSQKMRRPSPSSRVHPNRSPTSVSP
jgi:hypothetical protein